MTSIVDRDRAYLLVRERREEDNTPAVRVVIGHDEPQEAVALGLDLTAEESYNLYAALRDILGLSDD